MNRRAGVLREPRVIRKACVSGIVAIAKSRRCASVRGADGKAGGTDSSRCQPGISAGWATLQRLDPRFDDGGAGGRNAGFRVDALTVDKRKEGGAVCDWQSTA